MQHTEEPNMTATDAQIVATERYAWPGGYELFAITDDGGTLCNDCCRTEADTIAHSDPGDGWYVVGADHTGNIDDNETCDHCGRTIPA